MDLIPVKIKKHVRSNFAGKVLSKQHFLHLPRISQ